MSKLPIFERFLSVGKSQAKTQVVFRAKTQAEIFLLNWPPAPGLRPLRVGHTLLRHLPPQAIRASGAERVSWNSYCIINHKTLLCENISQLVSLPTPVGLEPEAIVKF